MRKRARAWPRSRASRTSQGEERWTANQQFEGGRHRAEIGSEIDRVGNDNESDLRIEGPRWVVAAQVAAKAVPCHAPNFSADLLDGAHQRKFQQRCPTHNDGKMRTGL